MDEEFDLCTATSDVQKKWKASAPPPQPAAAASQPRVPAACDGVRAKSVLSKNVSVLQFGVLSTASSTHTTFESSRFSSLHIPVLAALLLPPFPHWTSFKTQSAESAIVFLLGLAPSTPARPGTSGSTSPSRRRPAARRRRRRATAALGKRAPRYLQDLEPCKRLLSPSRRGSSTRPESIV